MNEKLIYTDRPKWSDVVFSVIVTIIISVYTDLSISYSVLLVLFYPILFLLFTKQYKFYETCFIQEGLVFSNKQTYQYEDIVKCTLNKRSVHSKATVSFFLKNKKRVNVHLDKQMGELLLILKDKGIKFVDNR